MALEILWEAYETNKSQHILELIGEFYVNLGMPSLASAIFRECYRLYNKLHITNIIYTEMPLTVAIVDDERKILYIPIPKCASSSVKNYFTFALYQKNYGEFVHSYHLEMYKIINLSEIQTLYKDYNKFTVVRNPLERVISYFTKNIRTQALVIEAHSSEKFLGLETMPSIFNIFFKFHQYRQSFIDFRHHTDPILGYLGDFAKHLKIYRMHELNDIKELLEDTYQIKIEDKRSMVTENMKDYQNDYYQQAEMIREFYQKDFFFFDTI